MKKSRLIVIKNIHLKQTRKNLRQILLEVIDRKIHSLEDDYYKVLENKIVQVKNNNLNIQQNSFLERQNSIKREIEKLKESIRHSILMCSSQSNILKWEELSDKLGLFDDINKNMGFIKELNCWFCEDCYHAYQDNLAPKNFFNEGKVFHQERYHYPHNILPIFKPCKRINWCPYGNLVEDFYARPNVSIFTCKVSGRDCPVFYVANTFFEGIDLNSFSITDIQKIPNLRTCRYFNENKIISRTHYFKPCIELKWCPYGNLGAKFSPRETLRTFSCKLFDHDCPVYYHAKRMSEDYELHKIIMKRSEEIDKRNYNEN